MAVEYRQHAAQSSSEHTPVHGYMAREVSAPASFGSQNEIDRLVEGYVAEVGELYFRWRSDLLPDSPLLDGYRLVLAGMTRIGWDEPHGTYLEWLTADDLSRLRESVLRLTEPASGVVTKGSLHEVDPDGTSDTTWYVDG